MHTKKPVPTYGDRAGIMPNPPPPPPQLLRVWFSGSWILGHFPFARTDRPDHSRRSETFTYNQNYPARSDKS